MSKSDVAIILKRKRRFKLVSTAFVCILIFSVIQLGPPESLAVSYGVDTDFNSPLGYNTLDPGQRLQKGLSVAVQADGKILVSGDLVFWGAGGPVATACIVLRYNTDGTLDDSFSSPDGYVLLEMGDDDTSDCYVGVQNSGKIVLAGTFYNSSGHNGNDFSVFRLNPDGSSDDTFNSPQGYNTLHLGGNHDIVRNMVVQNDDRIVVVGQTASNIYKDIAVARFKADGTVDTDFGSPNGFAILDLGNDSDDVASAAVQADGKIVVAGHSFNAADYKNADFAVARFNPNGTVDTDFASPNGFTLLNLGAYDLATAVAIRPNGKIVVLGSSIDYDTKDGGTVVAQYDTNGVLDPAFGDSGGYTKLEAGGSSDAAIQSDGKIVVAGARPPGNVDMGVYLARFAPNGILDASFGSNGYAFLDLFQWAHIESITLQSDERIVAAGNFNGEIFVARFLNSDSTVYSLTVTINGVGSGEVSRDPEGTSCGANCTQHADGTTVTLKAQPHAGSVFSGWSGHCSGTNASVDVTMDSNRACTATFTTAPVSYNLTVTTDGNGSGEVSRDPEGTSCGANCTQHADGTTVTLKAQPHAGSVFSGWSGHCSGTNASVDVTMDSNRACTATFTTAPVSYNLTVTTDGNGSGEVSRDPEGTSCGANCTQHADGTTVTLKAQPHAGSVFSGWSGHCSGTNASVDVTMDSNRACTATFNFVPVVAEADLSIAKNSDRTEAAPEQTLAYTIEVSNAGPDDATGATVRDTFPEELTDCTWSRAASADSGGVTAVPGDILDTVNISSGNSIVYTASCTINSSASGSLNNTAVVTAPPGLYDPDTSNNTDTNAVNIVGGSTAIPSIAHWGAIVLSLLIASATILAKKKNR